LKTVAHRTRNYSRVLLKLTAKLANRRRGKAFDGMTGFAGSLMSNEK